MKKQAFDNNLYLKIQREEINKRISSFSGKLYLEFGGKLFDDYHASRVLPGFQPTSKLQMLMGMKDVAEIVIVVNTQDIKNSKVRDDIGITYEAETTRLIDAYAEANLFVSSVVLSFYEPSVNVQLFEEKLKKNGIKVYKHYKINGYPQCIPLIVSEEGLGKNEYIETTRPLVVVTAPGPGSGKMATCLSQLYHDNKRGIKAGYAKYETFPIWNIPLNHPVNLAYEAATVDLNDVNMIDPFHLEAYGKVTVNYNRDIETFPLLRAIFEKIYSGISPYKSPTDMGVNMAGFAIKDDAAACKASKQEIIRRYYQAKKNNLLGKFSDLAVEKAEILMNKAGVTLDDRKCVKLCLERSNSISQPVCSIELPRGKVVTGKRSQFFTATAAMLLNALKVLAKIDEDLPLLSKTILEPIQDLKVGHLRNRNPRIRAEEVLIILSIQAPSNPLAELALAQLNKLKGCECHSSTILPDIELSILRRLGVNVTEEAIVYTKRLYTKQDTF